MSKISEKLNIINNAKNNIKAAIETDGIEVGNVGIQEYAEKINIINTNIANAYTEIENKGVVTTGAKNSGNLANVISAIQTGGTGGGSGDDANFISAIDNTLGANCTKLPDGITSLRDYAFYYCTNLAITELPKTITTIGKSAFGSCTNLQITETWGGQKSLSSSYIYIQQNCYLSCTKLKTIKILNINNPNNYPLHLENKCFQKCTGLTTVDFPENTKAIADYCFDGCSSLKTVICRAITPPSIYTTAFNGLSLENIYVPDDSVSSYQSASNWSKFYGAIKPLSELEG